MPEANVAKIWGLEPVVPYTNNKVKPQENPCPSLLYGVELEIENCHFDWATGGFTATEDGSLRNRGVEFISKPMSYSVLQYCLEMFFGKNKPKEVLEKDGSYSLNSNYSDRTSIHVHTNCQDLTLSQLTSICIIYQVFEKVLSRFIGHDRDKNIFCVPWHETQLSYRIVDNISKSQTLPIKQWQKYTALNLAPLLKQGTIEWRHMHGNSDLPFILTWLRLIGSIYRHAIVTPVEEIKDMFIQLNTSSMYNRSMDMVFGRDADVLRTPGFEILLEEGVLDMKYSLLSLNNKKSVTTNVVIDELIRDDVEPVDPLVFQPQDANAIAWRNVMNQAEEIERQRRMDRQMLFAAQAEMAALPNVADHVVLNVPAVGANGQVNLDWALRHPGQAAGGRFVPVQRLRNPRRPRG
jgi:hypothetical protein